MKAAGYICVSTEEQAKEGISLDWTIYDPMLHIWGLKSAKQTSALWHFRSNGTGNRYKPIVIIFTSRQPL